MKSMDDAVICRCEEVTKSQIFQALQAGDLSIDAIKKRTRAGMGFCQGRTCRRLIAQMISTYSDLPLEQTLQASIRVPVGPLPLTLIAETAYGDEEES